MSFVKCLTIAAILAFGSLAPVAGHASHLAPDGTFQAVGPLSLSTLGGAVRMNCKSVFIIQVTRGVGVITNLQLSPDPANGNNANCNNVQGANFSWALVITSATGGVAQGVKLTGINGSPVMCGAGPLPFNLSIGNLTFNGQLNPGACSISTGNLPTYRIVPADGAPLIIVP